MGKRRYKVTLMKYVRDAAGRGVDQDSRRFSFDTTAGGTSGVAKRRPFASGVDQDVADSRIRQICVRLGVFNLIKLDVADGATVILHVFLETSEKS